MHGIRLIPSAKLHLSKPTWWLESRRHFSSKDLIPAEKSFGVLTVMNDDLIKPRSGFGFEPNYEHIVDLARMTPKVYHSCWQRSHQREGRGKQGNGGSKRLTELELWRIRIPPTRPHMMENSHMLTRWATVRPSGVVLSSTCQLGQVIIIGGAHAGAAHSEMNDGDETCRFIQVRLAPDAPGHLPQYGSMSFDQNDRHNRLLHIIGGTGDVPAWDKIGKGSGIVKLHQDANVFVSESDREQVFDVPLGKGRQAYMLCIEGGVKVNHINLRARDAAELAAQADVLSLSIRTGFSGSHFMIIEMAQAA